MQKQRAASPQHGTPHARLRSVALWVAAILLSACGPTLRVDPESEAPRNASSLQQLDSAVSVSAVAPGVWVHVTIDPVTRFPSNGMLLETGDESVLFDTAWDDRQTDVLIEWAATTLGKPVRRAVITHSHNDRLGGLGALRRAGVKAVALGTTVQRAAAAGLIASSDVAATPGGGADPEPALDSIAGLVRTAYRDRAGFELFFPGVGHSPDNIVAYFPSSRILFGGCLTKPDTATTTGNVADADVVEWPRTVGRVAARYPNAGTVVPGHGAISSPGSLAVTQTLITEKGPAAVEALRRRQNR